MNVTKNTMAGMFFKARANFRLYSPVNELCHVEMSDPHSRVQVHWTALARDYLHLKLGFLDGRQDDASHRMPSLNAGANLLRHIKR